MIDNHELLDRDIKDRKSEGFISSLSYEKKEVKEILTNKIAEENEKVLVNTTSENEIFETSLLDQVDYEQGKINIVSLFSGAGGLDLGVELAELVLRVGENEAYQIIEDKEQYNRSREDTRMNYMYSNDLFLDANETYINNFSNSVVKDARDIRKVINFPKSDLILGGFPCPGFSAAGPRLLDDPRNFLYIHYIRALMQSKPAFFIAENVKGLMTMAKGQVLKQITEDFSAAGYKVSTHLVNARDYGVPQLRDRVFIVGVRNDIVNQFDFEYHLPEATHGVNGIPYVTLRDAIGDLPLDADDVFDSDYSSMYMSRNRKKNWDDQSFTIQASGRQAPQHPGGEKMKKIGTDKWEFQGNTNRRLSVRECARIQTFPDWFNFSVVAKNKEVSQNYKLNQQYKQIGNAVPVTLAEKISRPIIQFLIENEGLFN